MGRWTRREEGQTTLESLGIGAVVVAVVVALVAAAPGLGTTIGEVVQRLLCEITGEEDCGGPEVGDPVELPPLPEQTGGLPVDLPDLPDFPGVDLPDLPDLPNLPDLPFGPDLPDLPDLPDIPDIPPIDLPDLDAAGDAAVEALLVSLVDPLGPFGDTAPYIDEILDFLPEAGTVVEDLFPGTTAPQTDQLALAIAYALQQEDPDVETVHCGTSSSGIRVICVNNADGLVPDDASATTVGHIIFCETDCAGLIDHELVHVEQYEEYGDQFLPLYIAESAINGTCTDNRFEAPAYEVGGSCEN